MRQNESRFILGTCGVKYIASLLPQHLIGNTYIHLLTCGEVGMPFNESLNRMFGVGHGSVSIAYTCGTNLLAAIS